MGYKNLKISTNYLSCAPSNVFVAGSCLPLSWPNGSDTRREYLIIFESIIASHDYIKFTSYGYRKDGNRPIVRNYEGKGKWVRRIFRRSGLN